MEKTETKKIKIKNTTPNIGKFFRSREKVIVSHDRTYNVGKNAAKRERNKKG